VTKLRFLPHFGTLSYKCNLELCISLSESIQCISGISMSGVLRVVLDMLELLTCAEDATFVLK